MSKTYVCLWHSQYKHDMTKKPSQSLEAIFFLLFPHFCFLFERKNPGFYLFSMYPGALARAYKIIKEGLIKGKVYTESSRISVQLPPPMFSVHCASSHTQKVLSWKENFLCSTVQLPNLLKYTVCASPSSTDIYIPSWFIENCLENRWNIQQQFP